MKVAKIISVFVLVFVFVLAAILTISSVTSKTNSVDDERIKKEVGEALGVDPDYIVVAYGVPREYKDIQLSKAELNSDTETLLSLIFESKYWLNYTAFSSTIGSPSKGQYERHKANFNGFAEFAKREDAVSVLWAIYEKDYLGVKSISHKKTMVESMLISDDFYPKLTQEQKALLNLDY